MLFLSLPSPPWHAIRFLFSLSFESYHILKKLLYTVLGGGLLKLFWLHQSCYSLNSHKTYYLNPLTPFCLEQLSSFLKYLSWPIWLTVNLVCQGRLTILAAQLLLDTVIGVSTPQDQGFHLLCSLLYPLTEHIEDAQPHLLNEWERMGSQ